MDLTQDFHLFIKTLFDEKEETKNTVIREPVLVVNLMIVVYCLLGTGLYVIYFILYPLPVKDGSRGHIFIVKVFMFCSGRRDT